MQGDPEIITALNECLTAELTAVNQYFIHSRMCGNWDYQRLAKKLYDESIEEMKHADHLIERILYLDGVPNMQRYNPVRVGESVPEIHELDLATEKEHVDRLNEAVRLCRERSDNGSRALLETILTESEESVDWIESQLDQIEQMGVKNYLAQQVREG